jgi:transcriptional regulator with XRE-family HTH domain
MQSPKETAERLRERLIARRHALNLSQPELAKKSGVSERSIAAYESGKAQPTMRILVKLAGALLETPGSFFEETLQQSREVRQFKPSAAAAKSASRHQSADACHALRTLKSQVTALLGQIEYFERQFSGASSGNVQEQADAVVAEELVELQRKRATAEPDQSTHGPGPRSHQPRASGSEAKPS